MAFTVAFLSPTMNAMAALPFSPPEFHPQRATSFLRLKHRQGLRFFRQPPTIIRFNTLRFSSSSPKSSNSPSGYVGKSEKKEDFISRVLKENPSQAEPKFLVKDAHNNNLVLKRKPRKEKPFSDSANQLDEELLNREQKGDANEGVGEEEEVSVGKDEVKVLRDVHLKDILKEFRGQLYVPEEIFTKTLSLEEEKFERNMKTLPKMGFEEFMRELESDQVKFLVSRMNDRDLSSGYHDFVVELKEIPGEEKLQRTKWAMRLNDVQSKLVLDKYKGAQYEIVKRYTSYVTKPLEVRHPVAVSITNRVGVEFAAATAGIVYAVVVLGGFFVAAAAVATGSLLFVSYYTVWPVVRLLWRVFSGLAISIAERIWENLTDIFVEGGHLSRLYDFYDVTSSSLRVMRLPLLVGLTLAILIRFTMSRPSKDFTKWDIWQGIEFGQSKAQARVDGSTGVTFNDVAGIDEAVEELQELVRYLKNPELFDKMGIKPPHGVLLEGPPGCGKTLVAKAIAGEAGVPFYQMAGSEFIEVLVGVGSARIRDLFKRAKVNKPSVVFVDEIDALAARRQGILSETTKHFYSSETQERETTLNQLLIELDGFDTGKGVIFLGATNRRDLLDPALLRPGRFDRKIRIVPPNAKGRLEILKVHARKVKLSSTVDLSTYAQNLPGWTGAMLAQLMQEAALVAVRNKHQSILPPDMDDAVDKLMEGPKLQALNLSQQGQIRRATSEVGMALTSHLLRRFENAKVEFCERVSIVPRGQTYSRTIFRRLDDEAYMFERKPQLLHRLQIFLGGRAAEEVIFGRDTSVVSAKHLADASWLAREIVAVWNLEDPLTLGEPAPWRKPISFTGPRFDYEGSLNDTGLRDRPLISELADTIAYRTEELVRDMYNRTVSLIRRHHAALVKTVEVLKSKMEISGDEIDYIIENYPADSPVDLVLDEENPGSLPFFYSWEGSAVSASALPRSEVATEALIVHH